MRETNPQYNEALRLRLSGFTYREIAEQMGIARQRAQQLVRPRIGICELVRKRSNDKCEQCGEAITCGHIHHKVASGIEAADFNAPENLQYLCPSCHTKADKNLTPKFQIEPLNIPKKTSLLFMEPKKEEVATVRLDQQTMVAVKECATQENRSISQILRFAVREYLDRRASEGPHSAIEASDVLDQTYKRTAKRKRT